MTITDLLVSCFFHNEEGYRRSPKDKKDLTLFELCFKLSLH